MFPKLDISTPVSTVLYTVRTGGPDVGGPDVLLCFQNCTSLPPLLQSYILCDTGGPDVGGTDVGGPDVGGPDFLNFL